MFKKLFNLNFLSLSLFSKAETLAIYVQYPIADLECAQALGAICKRKYKIKYLNHSTLTKKALKKVDCLVFPGGLGDSDNFDHLLQDKKKIVQDYLSSGGKYLGICMGGYLAGKHYFNILKNVDAVQYIKRKNAELRYENETVTQIKWKGKTYKMFFYDGCALIGDQSGFKTIARYKNGDPMAIIQGDVGIIGCHPESPKYWYENTPFEKYWHGGRDHELLLDFIEELMDN